MGVGSKGQREFAVGTAPMKYESAIGGDYGFSGTMFEIERGYSYFTVEPNDRNNEMTNFRITHGGTAHSFAIDAEQRSHLIKWLRKQK